MVGTSGYIYKTTNAGQNWTSVRTTDGKTLYCVQFANADSGVAAGFNNTVARTTDGGATWKNLSGVIGNHKSVHFTSVSNGFIASGGTILNTTNGGATWTPTYIPTYTELRSVHFSDASNGFVAGYYGMLYRTTDGGTTWNQNSRGTTVQLNSIHYAGANDGVVSGNTDSSKGTVLFTNDGGKNWRKHLLGLTTSNLYCAYIKNGSTAIVAGQGIYKTTDSGKTWTRPMTTTTVLGMAFVSGTDNNGYAVGKNTSNAGFVLRSTNSGDAWTTATGNLNVRELRGVFVHSSSTVTVVGLTNIGDPVVCRTTNNGTNWTVLTVSGANAVHFPTATVGMAVGDGGKISRTTDGGTTWVPQSSGTTEALKSVSFASADVGVAVGSKNTILHTTNGGTTWEKQLADISTDLFGVVMTGPLTATTVGFGGTILNTTNGGITAVSEGERSSGLAPAGYTLQQNYPNPFNPSTNIEYQVSIQSRVTISVYDALGRIVATLVNDVKEAGMHSVSFNGSGLASGMYLYRLTAGEKSEMKRMMLVK